MNKKPWIWKKYKKPSEIQEEKEKNQPPIVSLIDKSIFYRPHQHRRFYAVEKPIGVGSAFNLIEQCLSSPEFKKQIINQISIKDFFIQKGETLKDNIAKRFKASKLWSKQFITMFIITFLLLEGVEHLLHDLFGIELDHILSFGGSVGTILILGFKFHVICCVIPALVATWKCTQNKHTHCNHNHNKEVK